MNWVDFAIICLLLLFALDAVHKSFLGEVFDFLSFLLAFFLSFRFYNQTGSFFETTFQLPHSFAVILGFATIWFLVELILFGMIQLTFPKFKAFVKIDRILQPLAIIPAVLRGFIFISLILLLVGTFPVQPDIKIAVHQSKLGSLILDKTQQLESPFKNIFGGITNDTLTFFTIKPKSDESINLGFQTSDFHPDATLENQMIDLVNKERTIRGLNALTFNPALQKIAREHSADMFKRGYFSHYSPEGKTVADRAKQNGINYLVIGENLAYAPNLELAHNGLMNSEGHKANILSVDYHKIGIGILDGGVYGLMVTQVFSN
jgi:uncharacterized protein YkwD